MQIEDVRNLAKLANISLSSEEEKSFSESLSVMVGFIGGVKNWTECDSLSGEMIKTPLREDVPEQSLDCEEILKNAFESQEGFFCVKERG